MPNTLLLRVLNSAMSIAFQVFLAAMEKPAIVKQEEPAIWYASCKLYSRPVNTHYALIFLFYFFISNFSFHNFLLWNGGTILMVHAVMSVVLTCIYEHCSLMHILWKVVNIWIDHLNVAKTLQLVWQVGKKGLPIGRTGSDLTAWPERWTW